MNIHELAYREQSGHGSVAHPLLSKNKFAQPNGEKVTVNHFNLAPFKYSEFKLLDR